MVKSCSHFDHYDLAPNLIHTECVFAITPVEDSNNSRLDLKITITNSTLTLGQTTSGYEITNAAVTFKNHSAIEKVNSTVCHISTLEVYRGRDQAIEIRHSGFSLGDNGSIEVLQWMVCA